MKIPDPHGIFTKCGNGKEFFRKRKAKDDISCFLDGSFERNVLLGFFRKKHVYSYNDRPVFFEIIYNPSVVCPFEILKSSESSVIGKRFVVDGNNGDISICGSICTIFAEENVFYSEVPPFYKLFTERILAQKHNDTDNKYRKKGRDNFFIVYDFFEIHRVFDVNYRVSFSIRPQYPCEPPLRYY